jgi:hypothetical protein
MTKQEDKRQCLPVMLLTIVFDGVKHKKGCEISKDIPVPYMT